MNQSSRANLYITIILFYRKLKRSAGSYFHSDK